MRNFLNFLMFCSCLAFIAGFVSGCEDMAFEESVTITMNVSSQSFDKMKDEMYGSLPVWGKDLEQIDTNEFILSVYSRQGGKVYEGKYGKRPSEFTVLPGIYDIKFTSGIPKGPAFNAPVYGDEFHISVEASSQLEITLMCSQINSAVRLNFTESFKEKFKGEGLIVKDASGQLLYPYSSNDFCYVTSGDIEILYNNGISDTLLLARQIPVSQMLTINMSYVEASRAVSMKVEKDTVRKWKTENFNAALKIPSGAYTIEQAKQMIGEKNVMVFGFVFGGDVTQNTVRVRAPFSSRTNLIIAPDMRERNRNNMFAVELPSGDVRDALNLVDNRKLLGAAIVVTGNIVENYFGYPGIKGTKDGVVLY